MNQLLPYRRRRSATTSGQIEATGTLTFAAEQRKELERQAHRAANTGIECAGRLQANPRSVLIDDTEVKLSFENGNIQLTVTVAGESRESLTFWALSGLTNALNVLYTALLEEGNEARIHNIRIVLEAGGWGEYQEQFAEPLQCGVVVTSDAIYHSVKQDTYRDIIESITCDWPLELAEYITLPDDKERIAREIIKLAERDFDLVFTVSGTGASPSDVTVEATSQVIEKELPGIGEFTRAYGMRRTPRAMLSRQCAGIIGRTLILNLPGSETGLRESLEAIYPGFEHVYTMLWELDSGTESRKILRKPKAESGDKQ